MDLWAQSESIEVQLIALAFEHTYCVARQCGKNYQFFTATEYHRIKEKARQTHGP